MSVPHLSVKTPEPVARKTARSLDVDAALGLNAMVKVPEAGTFLISNLNFDIEESYVTSKVTPFSAVKVLAETAAMRSAFARIDIFILNNNYNEIKRAI